MDAGQFDGFVQSLSERSSRRGVFGLLRALPLLGGLAAMSGDDDAAAKGRRQRRKNAQKGKGKGKGKGKSPCQPDATATTCAGKCGLVQNNCQQTVDCVACHDGQTCAACAALDDPDLYDRAADCCGESVCDCGQIVYYPRGRVVQCKRPGVCRPNHAPVALSLDVKHPWRFANVPVDLVGYEPDSEEFLTFRIVTNPEHGFLTLVNEVFVGEPGASALPAPPIPADAPRDCFPRCSATSLTCDWNTRCPDCNGRWCPEGFYANDTITYIPFSTTFTGTDSFTYAAVDLYGAEGPPALVTITIFEV